MLLYVRIFLLLLCTCCGIAGFKELVFEDGTNGVQVVDHVIDLIGRTCLLDNEIFLRRMADIETGYGTDVRTYRHGYNGGIWNIGQDLFNSTKENPKLFDEYTAIKQNLNIDWSDITWSDLRKPIYSGLAVTLLLRSKNIRVIPENAELQATIWSVLRAGNRAFDYFVKIQNSSLDCPNAKYLDLIIILDFRKLSTHDLVHVETFMETFLKKFQLSNDVTRVGMVTKHKHPVAGWYLNSSRPGFTLLDALKSLRYTSGPTTVGDSLKFTRETMFTVANGARDGSARLALLFTDNITQSAYAISEARMLQKQGIFLIAVEVQGNGTSSGEDTVEQLVAEPSCRNARKVQGFQGLESIVNRLELSICNDEVSTSPHIFSWDSHITKQTKIMACSNSNISAPIILMTGNFTYPCNKSIVARLPDTSDAVSLMVSVHYGGVAVYAGNKYGSPDKSSYDVRLVTSITETQTPVLYVRGTNPIYIRVNGQEHGATCNGVYTIHVKRGPDVFNGQSGVCIVAGTVRQCTDLDMGLITRDIVLLSNQDVLNLCDPRSHTVEYYPHPVDTSKFIMCDQHGQAFVGLCPVNQSQCLQNTSGCQYSNPCTSQAILDGHLFHNDPCGNQLHHITCTHFGVALLSQCRKGRMWNQDSQACVFKYVHDASAVGNSDVTSIDNPCIHEHSDHVYFPYPGDTKKYILCDIHGNAFAFLCSDGRWNQQTKTCISVAPPNLVG